MVVVVVVVVVIVVVFVIVVATGCCGPHSVHHQSRGHREVQSGGARLLRSAGGHDEASALRHV